MSRRLSLIPPALLLGVCLVVLPACKKKPTEEGGGGGGGTGAEFGPAPSGPPPSVNSDYLVFAQVNVKHIRDSALFSEVKQAVTKAGGTEEWNKAEEESVSKFGIKPTDLETVTAVVTEASKGDAKYVVIVTANKAFDKTAMFKKEKVSKPDSSGFYKVENDTWLHFPDDKTLAIVSPDLAQKYLDGYAKNRSGWPLTADLTRAATGHTAFVVVNLQKAPREVIDQVGGEGQFSALATTQKVIVATNLRGKELSLGVRATYADAATATKAKEQAQALLDMATGFVGMAATSKEMAEMAALKPAITEAQRMLKEAKLEAAGSDVTLTASYKANFDLPQMAGEVVKKIQGTAGRMTGQNNYKQAILGMINYSDSNGGVIPVLGVVANGQPMRNPTDKPLLSWRVAILPYIEQDNLYKQFKLDEPWDSEHNKKLIPQMPKIYAPVDKPGRPGFTHMQMVVGQNAMRTPSARYPAGIPDGTSNTIALVEAANPVEWTKPDDVMLPPKLAPGDLKRKFGGVTPGGFIVAMWDGSVRLVKDTVSERTLGIALNPADGQVLPSDWDGIGFSEPPKGPPITPPPPRPPIPPKGPTPPLGKK